MLLLLVAICGGVNVQPAAPSLTLATLPPSLLPPGYHEHTHKHLDERLLTAGFDKHKITYMGIIESVDKRDETTHLVHVLET
jgi:hypothetical protein